MSAGRLAALYGGVVLALLCLLSRPGHDARAAQAETPAEVCRHVGTDDALRPIPASVVPQVNAVFRSTMPEPITLRSTVYRCDRKRVLVCNSGANLPCGKANTDRRNAGAIWWCRQHPDAAFVPTFAAGHDTIFAWRCRGSVAEIERRIFSVDHRGFVANFWRVLPAAR